MLDDTRKLLGRCEYVDLPSLGLFSVPARIDTGAKTSSIWASDITRDGDSVYATLFDQGYSLYTGEVLKFDDFTTVRISTSTGQVTRRYKVRLVVSLQGKRISARFTLADRSTQEYPVLIGRNIMLGKFIVDVNKVGIKEDITTTGEITL
jgi:hypothetical protein